MTTETLTETITLPMKSGRPLVFEGKEVARHRRMTTKDSGWGSNHKDTTVTTSYLYEGDGIVAYRRDWRSFSDRQPETETGSGTDLTAVWGSYDDIDPNETWSDLRMLLLSVGRDDLVYERLGDGPYTAQIERQTGRTMTFHGTELASAKIRLPTDGSRNITDKTRVFKIPDGYRLVAERYGNLKVIDAATPAEVYAILVWRRKNLDLWSARSVTYPEPLNDILQLLIELAKVDPAFQPIAYRKANGDDPIQALWTADRAPVIEAQLQYEADERERRRLEMEERERQERAWAEQEDAREAAWAEEQRKDNEARSVSPEVEPQPLTYRQRLEALVNGPDYFDDVARTTALGFLMLADEISAALADR